MSILTIYILIKFIISFSPSFKTDELSFSDIRQLKFFNKFLCCKNLSSNWVEKLSKKSKKKMSIYPNFLGLCNLELLLLLYMALLR